MKKPTIPEIILWASVIPLVLLFILFYLEKIPFTFMKLVIPLALVMVFSGGIVFYTNITNAMDEILNKENKENDSNSN